VAAAGGALILALLALLLSLPLPLLRHVDKRTDITFKHGGTRSSTPGSAAKLIPLPSVVPFLQQLNESHSDGEFIQINGGGQLIRPSTRSERFNGNLDERKKGCHLGIPMFQVLSVVNGKDLRNNTYL
jgi:hypothetical protein